MSKHELPDLHFNFKPSRYQASRVECYCTEYILRIETALKIVLGIGILLGLVHNDLIIYVLNLFPEVRILPNLGAINLIKMRI